MSRWYGLVLLMVCITQAQAMVSLAGTRLVFPGAFSEVAIEVSNRDKRDVLLQAWLGTPGDDDDPASAQPGIELPFVVTRPWRICPPRAGKCCGCCTTVSACPPGTSHCCTCMCLKCPSALRPGRN